MGPIVLGGAGGHALELLHTVLKLGFNEVLFFDDTDGAPKDLHGHLVVSEVDALGKFTGSFFSPATGTPFIRKKLFGILSSVGLEPYSVLASSAIVESTSLSGGINIMEQAYIAPNARIATGALINRAAGIHHDAQIGRFCEVGPMAQCLGKVTVEDGASIGAGAIILPGVFVGEGAIVGAGAVVNRDVAPYETVVGVPARPIRRSSSIS